MRFLAWLARHPWLRTGLVVLAVVVALLGGMRLWMSVPSDAVHIMITHVNQDLSDRARSPCPLGLGMHGPLTLTERTL
jgi:hypothetical protein